MLFDILFNPSFRMTTILANKFNNLKSKETKSRIKAYLPYLSNSYFYNYKPSPHILRKHRVLRNLRKNKDNIITKPDKGNGVFILDQKLYNNAIEEIISDARSFTKTFFMQVETKKLFKLNFI